MLFSQFCSAIDITVSKSFVSKSVSINLKEESIDSSIFREALNKKRKIELNLKSFMKKILSFFQL